MKLFVVLVFVSTTVFAQTRPTIDDSPERLIAYVYATTDSACQLFAQRDLPQSKEAFDVAYEAARAGYEKSKFFFYYLDLPDHLRELIPDKLIDPYKEWGHERAYIGDALNYVTDRYKDLFGGAERDESKSEPH